MLPFVLGVVTGFAAAFFIGVLLLTLTLATSRLLLFPTDGTSPKERAESRALPRATLRVADDGCGVIRTDFEGDPPDGLQWVVTDQQGFQVLGRNALGETRYRYYRAGEYKVVLEALDGEKYAPVSNRVEIQCPQ